MSENVRYYIDYVASVPGGVVIHLTDAGAQLGSTCAGAARVVRMASGLYAQLPADQRSHADLLWADPYITREVYGHSVAFRYPWLRARANPVNIDFGAYTTPVSEGLIWRNPDLLLGCQASDLK